MGKGLIGINLEACMKSILKGEVSFDDISVIYDDYEVSNGDDKYKFLKGYFCEGIAREMAQKELGKATNRAELENIHKRTDELLPQLQLQADKLLEDLISTNKICELNYKVPKGNEHEVQIAYGEGLSDNIETITKPTDRYYFRINEKNYALSNETTSLYGLAYHDKHIWYDNELQIIAELLKHGNRPSGVLDVHSSQKRTSSAAMAKLLFPQYSKEINSIIKSKREIIEIAGDSTSDEPLPGMDYDGILQKLEELVQQRASQDKKELFMSMVETAKNGTLDMMRMTESKKYDEIYSQLGNNNGPFGLVVGGITKDGKVSVYLAELMYKQLPSNMVGGSMISSLEFEESDLSDFLDRFYDMNNMEILNEFYKNQPDYVKNTSLQEYKDNGYGSGSFYNRLLTLNGLDYLTQNKTKLDGPSSNDYYDLENGLEITLEDDKDYILFSTEGDAALYDITNGEFIKAFKDPKFEEYSSAFLQSVEDLPRIYEAITKGTYRREDFIPAIETKGKQTPLQKREAELSALEAEAIIDTAELKEFESKEGQNIGE